MAAGVVHIPWYANLFRGDALAAGLAEIAPVAQRYGATDYHVYRSRDDMYKFLQMTTFEDKDAWERYWYGPEFIQFRAQYAGFYQVPILYVWNDVVIEGGINREPASIVGAPTEGDTV
jgi:quinol monooxygenase YgiN